MQPCEPPIAQRRSSPSSPDLLSNGLVQEDAYAASVGDCNNGIVHFSVSDILGQGVIEGGEGVCDPAVPKDTLLSYGLEPALGPEDHGGGGASARAGVAAPPWSARTGPAAVPSGPSEAVRHALLAASEPDGALEVLRGAVLAASEPDAEALVGALLVASEPDPLGPGLSPASAATERASCDVPLESGDVPLGPGLCPAGRVARARQDAGKHSCPHLGGGGLGIGGVAPKDAEPLYCSTRCESEEDWDTIFEHGASPSEEVCSDSSPSDPQSDSAETEKDSKLKVEALLMLGPGLTAFPHNLVSNVPLRMVA